MAKIELPPWATEAKQDAHKGVSDDTNTRVRGLETSMDGLANTLAGLRVGQLGQCFEATSRVDTANDKVYLRWRDPNNTVVQGFTMAEWKETWVLKKQGTTPPASIYDGMLVVKTTTRNQYATTWFEDTQADGDQWTYRAFPVATNGYISESLKNVFKPYTLYTFVLDENDSNEQTCITYADDCAGFDPLYVDFSVTDSDTSASDLAPEGSCHWGDWRDAFFMPRPCMLKRDGTVDYYLDPDNNHLKADGETASDIGNTSYDGNAMMEFPKVFVKIVRDATAGTLIVQFSDAKLDSNFECWPCKKSDGEYADHFYLPIFEGTSVNNTLRSIIPNTTTEPLASTNSTTELAYARNNGTGWETTTWADEDLIRMLGILVMRRLDVQSAIAYMPGEHTSALTNNVGTGAKKGMFYGHSGVSNPINTKFFGMENWWGHRWRRPQGLNLVNGKIYVKLTRSTIDGSAASDFITSDTAADYTAGYIDTGITVATNWNASFMTKATGVSKCMAAPMLAGGAGSNSSYFCDACWSGSGVRCLICGGHVTSGVRAGLFASALSNAPSNAHWSLGASLSYHTP